MSALDLLEFSGADYKLEKFVDAFRSQLPLIMIVTIGIDSKDDPLHSISTEDMFWIYALKHQRRVLAFEKSSGKSTSKYFSIPLDYPHHKFQTVKTLNCGGGSQHKMHREEKETKVVLGQPQSLKDLVEDMKRSPSGHGGQLHFTFQNTEEIRIIREGAADRRRQISTLKYVIEYEQRYLVGHPIVKNEMICQTTMIPVYLDVSVSVATGFRGQDNATFQQWRHLVNEAGFKLPKDTGQVSQAIIEFKDIPDCCDYEYIRPYNYLKAEVFLSSKPDDNDHKTSGNSRGNAYEAKYDGGKTYLPPQIPPRNRCVNVRLPPLPTAGDKNRPPADKPTATRPRPSIPVPKNAIDARTNEARLSAGAVNQTSVADDDDDDEEDYETIDETVIDKSTDQPKSDTATPIRKSASVGIKLTSYRHLAEIPTDVRVSELSVEEVAHSLDLLGLASHADTVRTRLIDGAIVADLLVADNLLGSVGFSDFEAMQFKKFLNGWRPRI